MGASRSRAAPRRRAALGLGPISGPCMGPRWLLWLLVPLLYYRLDGGRHAHRAPTTSCQRGWAGRRRCSCSNALPPSLHAALTRLEPAPVGRRPPASPRAPRRAAATLAVAAGHGVAPAQKPPPPISARRYLAGPRHGPAARRCLLCARCYSAAAGLSKTYVVMTAVRRARLAGAEALRECALPPKGGRPGPDRSPGASRAIGPMLQFFRRVIASKFGALFAVLFLGLIAFAFAAGDMAGMSGFGGGGHAREYTLGVARPTPRPSWQRLRHNRVSRSRPRGAPRPSPPAPWCPPSGPDPTLVPP